MNSIYQHPPPPRMNSVKSGSITFSNYATPPNYVNNGYGGVDHHKSTTVKIGVGNSIDNNNSNYASHYVGLQAPLEERRSGDAKVTYLTEYELNQPQSSSNYEFLQHERLSALKQPQEVVGNRVGKSTYVVDGGHTTDSSSCSDRVVSDRVIASTMFGGSQQQLPRSEDELSGSSSSVSPQRRRRNPPIGAPMTTRVQPVVSSVLNQTPSGSRNQSPRTIIRTSDEGTAKKRPVARNNPNRNSANLTSSTLQEDLMKLINPEFENLSDSQTSKSPLNHTTSVSITAGGTNGYSGTGSAFTGSAFNGGTPYGSSRPSGPSSVVRPLTKTHSISELGLLKSRSRENIAARFSEAPAAMPLNGQVGPVANGQAGANNMGDNVSAEVSYHMARPATVISNNSSTSSPSVTSANNSGRSERSLSTGVTPRKLLPTTPTKVLLPSQLTTAGPAPSSSNLPLPDDKRMDWSALVDTATRAIHSEDGNAGQQQQQRRVRKSSTVLLNNTEDVLPGRSTVRMVEEGLSQLQKSSFSRPTGISPTSSASSSTTTSPPSTPSSSAHRHQVDERMGQLLDKVSQLETKLTSETVQKSHLEEEVAALREENLRLQEESQTASQQLKRFTEWFFQTIDKT